MSDCVTYTTPVIWWCVVHGDVADDGISDCCHIGRARDEHELCHAEERYLLPVEDHR